MMRVSLRGSAACAAKVQPKGKRSLADQAVEMIGKFFRMSATSAKSPPP
jgi:hypothetical protein